MAGYKLATYKSANGPRAGIVVDETIFDAAKLKGKSVCARHHACVWKYRTNAVPLVGIS
jgi:hypothetical protein